MVYVNTYHSLGNHKDKINLSCGELYSHQKIENVSKKNSSLTLLITFENSLDPDQRPDLDPNCLTMFGIVERIF